MAFPVTLNGRTYTLTDFEGTNYVDGLPDAFEDFVTHAGDIYNSTSTTSNSIGTGSKTFTVEANKPYQAGTPLRIADAAAPSTNFLDTVVTSYSGTTLVVNSIGYGGSGTKTSWTVNIGGAKTVDGTLGLSQGGTGATDAAGARTNIDVYSKADADSRFLNVSGEASNVTMNGDVTIGDASSDTLTVNATADFNTGFNVDGTVTSDGLTVAGNLSVDGGTIKLDGNYPTGTGNVALGGQALDDGSLTGGNNTAVGDRALTANTSGGENVAVGALALFTNTTGSNNTASGYASLFLNTTGSYNTSFGQEALRANTTASYNTAVGYQAGYSNTTGTRGTFVGMGAGYTNSTASYNTAVGWYALRLNTTGDLNTAMGDGTLQTNTTGSQNTGIGQSALGNNTTGNYNTALGRQTLLSNTTASNNTAVGYQAGLGNTTGSEITALGYHALYANTTGASNVAMGYAAAGSNTTGISNVAIGRQSLASNTTANNSTAVGYQAGYSSTTGGQNTSFGYRAGYSNSLASYNVFLGHEAGYLFNGSSGNAFNTFVGVQSGYHVSTGTKNTIIGGFGGNSGGLDIRTLNNHIVLADGDGNPRLYMTDTGSLNHQRTYDWTTASSANVVVQSNGYFQRSTSSRRYKNTINDATHGLSDLLELRSVTYKGNNDGDTVYGGLIAEEVHDAGLTEFVVYSDDADGNKQPEALAYGNMVSLCIKAIQEQQATITALQARIDALENA